MRRDLFILGMASLLLSCRKRAAPNAAGGGRDASEPSSESPSEDQSAAGLSTGDIAAPESAGCQEDGIYEFDSYEKHHKSFSAVVRRYAGHGHGDLLAVHMPDFSAEVDAVKMILLLDGNNQLLAGQAVTELDFELDENGEMRPFVFENIAMTGREIRVLFLMAGEKRGEQGPVYKYQVPADVEDVLTFEGQPVRSIGSAMKRGFDINSGFFPFAFTPRIDLSQVRERQERDAEDGGSPYDYSVGLYHADERTSYDAVGLEGTVVTDIMGKVLSRDGASFGSIIRHPFFVIYKKGKNGWIRQIVRGG